MNGTHKLENRESRHEVRILHGPRQVPPLGAH
jgi:hypothetical protein